MAHTFTMSSRVRQFWDFRAVLTSFTLDAGSAELDQHCTDPVVIYMPEISKTHLGGTMRLGLRPTLFEEKSEQWSKIRALYGGAEAIWERHRHRYEINPEYIERIEKGYARSTAANGRPSTPTGHSSSRPKLPTSPSMSREEQYFQGNTQQSLAPGADKLVFVGKSESRDRMQVAELVPTDANDRGHPYFVGMQAHPEFASRPLNPSPPFLGFVAAAAGGVDMLQEQISAQRNFRPPHPPSLMIMESERERRREADAQGVEATSAAQSEKRKPPTTPPGAKSPTLRAT